MGSNKSLYTLIAVVVFGIFLSLSYFLFQDSLKGVLADVLNKTSQSAETKLGDSLKVNYFPDPNFRDTNTLTYFTSRNVTEDIDTIVRKDGENTLHHTFLLASNGVSADNAVALEFYSDDLTDLNDNILRNMIVGDTLTISFYAKADKPLKLSSRPGGKFYDLSNIQTRSLTTEWQKIDFVFTLKTKSADTASAWVYWVDTPGNVWLNDLSVTVNNNY